jgi:S1-C subfamily serine protease
MEAPGNPSAPSALVASIQIMLARLGYDPGPPTGIVGLKTNMAISAFQKGQGERGDGLPSVAVRAQLEKVLAQRSAAAEAPPNARAAAPERTVSPPDKHAISAVSSGTGFYISQDTIITNFHVVNGCVEMHIRKNGADQGSARVMAVSQGDDLAALRADLPSKAFLKLRVGAPIKPAEAVLVFGYPLAGALSSTGNTTLGNVTALTGLRDDSRYIQISASVQPGNSGGPAVDESGRLMGVVVSKLNAMAIAAVTGDIPQNVNFAIKVSTLSNFLEAHNIAYEADSQSHELSNTQRAERTEASSTQLECWK